MNVDKKIIQYLGKEFKREETIRQISIATKTPYMTLNRTIKKLAETNIIILKKQGKATVCSLNTSNPLAKQHLILAEEEFKNEIIQKKPLIKKICEAIAGNNFTAVLFGSYAQDTEKKHSDIDLAFVVSNSKKDIKHTINELQTIEQINDIEINTITFTEKEFKNMLRAKEENVGKQMIKNHAVLYNPELFWNIAYEAVK